MHRDRNKTEMQVSALTFQLLMCVLSMRNNYNPGSCEPGPLELNTHHCRTHYRELQSGALIGLGYCTTHHFVGRTSFSNGSIRLCFYCKHTFNTSTSASVTQSLLPKQNTHSLYLLWMFLCGFWVLSAILWFTMVLFTVALCVDGDIFQNALVWTEIFFLIHVYV